MTFAKKTNEIDSKLRHARSERYALQSVARVALPNERVSKCLRLSINQSLVQVWQHIKTQKAFYGGLAVCGSVWHCPVCASKIAERRKLELMKAFEQHIKNKGYIAMLTLTFSHSRFDSLRDILTRFNKALAKFRSGKRYQQIRNKMKMLGTIRVFEITWSNMNGFHPHVHIGIFYYKNCDLKEIENEMYELWKNATEKFNLVIDREHGIKLENAENANEYLSKHGTWSLESELSKSHIKKGRLQSLTPFDFLRRYLDTNDKKYLGLFKEYAECFKGKRQIQWSRGLKQHFNLDDKTDEQIAKEKIEEADLLGLLNIEQWKYIIKRDKRADLLDLCELVGFDKAIEIIFNKEKKNESSLAEDSQVIKK